MQSPVNWHFLIEPRLLYIVASPTAGNKSIQSIYVSFLNSTKLIQSLSEPNVLENGINARDRYSKSTPLHFAAYGGQSLAAKWLVDKNADVEARDMMGRTASCCT